MRIESISLDLCIGNKASLVWVGQDHFFHRLKFLELIVDQTPIPACFNDGFAWPFQTGKKLRKPSCAIAFDSSLAQLPPALIQRAQHAVLLVDIYSDVVHENSFLSSSSLRTEMLLSCYLTLGSSGRWKSAKTEHRQYAGDRRIRRICLVIVVSLICCSFLTSAVI